MPVCLKEIPEGDYIGLMSGTSLDGVDGVIVRFSENPRVEVVAYAHLPMPEALREKLLVLNKPGADELNRSALAANELVFSLYAPVVEALLRQSDLKRQQIAAIGAHGQTVRHHPDKQLAQSYTIQINAPALLAELSQITVVADFRSRDVAAGGQGAPLVPAFHAQLFGREDETRGVLNLGGISNLTILKSDGDILGFDCGPANVLLDAWSQLHRQQPYDHHGQWAASGKQVPALLKKMLLSEPYFSLPAPKSTGRDLFHMPWLDAMLAGFEKQPVQDIQNTLLELAVQTCAQAARQYAPDMKTLIVCGGGALNAYMMQRLQKHLPTAEVASSDVYGLPPLQVEATAFAWLARQCMQGQTGNIQAVTGAKGQRILGAIYQA